MQQQQMSMAEDNATTAAAMDSSVAPTKQRNRIPRIIVQGIVIVSVLVILQLMKSYNNVATTTTTSTTASNNNNKTTMVDQLLQLQHSLRNEWRQLNNESFVTIPRAIVRAQTTTTTIHRQQQQQQKTNDVTVTVHLSMDKWYRFLFLLHRWNGPTSASIYFNNLQDIDAFFDRINHLLDHSSSSVTSSSNNNNNNNNETTGNNNNSNNGKTNATVNRIGTVCDWRSSTTILQNTTFHVFLHKTNFEYPHNRLRQLALNNIDTHYFLTLDSDFVTPMNCHGRLYRLMFPSSGYNDIANILRYNQTFMVLPAFQLFRHLNDHELDDSLLPNTKHEAALLVQDRAIAPFHLKLFAPGHGPTNFPKWYNDDNEEKRITAAATSNTSSSKDYYWIDYQYKFEPYVLGYRRSDDENTGLESLPPNYWETFRGFGYDKWSWFVEAHYMGYKFAVLKDLFVVHLDHPYRTKKKIKPHNRNEMLRFVHHLIVDRNVPVSNFQNEFVITTTENNNNNSSDQTHISYHVGWRTGRKKRGS